MGLLFFALKLTLDFSENEIGDGGVGNKFTLGIDR
jgi:hypothetical protein